jgi:hypothetical protein
LRAGITIHPRQEAEKSKAVSRDANTLLSLAVAARLIVLLRCGHRIGAGKPAMQIDVGATAGAEGAERRFLRLATDGTDL